MTFSRQNPSPRYVELVAIYREMHLNGERHMGMPAAMTFDGRSLRPYAEYIKRLIDATGALTLLDYGSGKGQQYDLKTLEITGKGRWDSVIDYWGVDEVTCFDPAYEPYSRMPRGKFDGVVSTDVLEHCPEEDVGWIVDEIFSFASKFVFATIASYPARKRLPSGENAHCTIRPARWWQEIFRHAAATRPGVIWEALVLSRSSPEAQKLTIERIGS
jgi:hypothetical protein